MPYLISSAVNKIKRMASEKAVYNKNLVGVPVLFYLNMVLLV